MLARLAFAALLLASPFGAHAQLFRAYLSVNGNDSSDCTVKTPCRLLPAALSAVADGGEIWILDSANFNAGTVDINKSVSILAVPGQIGSFMATNGGAALTVTTGGLKIQLRNLSFARNAVSPGFTGLSITGASSVWVEDCLFANLSTAGISATVTSYLQVKNTTFRNDSAAITAKDGARVNVTHSEFLSVNRGIDASATVAGATTTVNLTDSTISSLGAAAWGTGSTWGVLANATDTATARVFVSRSTIEGMTYGAEVVGFGGVTVANSSITNNGTGLRNMSSGALNTTGNNYIADNGLDAAGTITAIGTH